MINTMGGSWSHYGMQIPNDSTKECPMLGPKDNDAFSLTDTECMDGIS